MKPRVTKQRARCAQSTTANELCAALEAAAVIRPSAMTQAENVSLLVAALTHARRGRGDVGAAATRHMIWMMHVLGASSISSSIVIALAHPGALRVVDACSQTCPSSVTWPVLKGRWIFLCAREAGSAFGKVKSRVRHYGRVFAFPVQMRTSLPGLRRRSTGCCSDASAYGLRQRRRSSLQRPPLLRP